MTTVPAPEAPFYKRLLSLDFMRGLIMVLLALESTGLYEHLEEAGKGTMVDGKSLNAAAGCFSGGCLTMP
jgi:hypothetical protein